MLGALRSEKELPPEPIRHVIPLLAWDAVASEVIVTLRGVAEEHIDTFADALIDRPQNFLVRRGIARVLSACRSQRAVDALIVGLGDVRFDVRVNCARSLASIVTKNRRVHVDRNGIFDAVREELKFGPAVWEGFVNGIGSQDERSFGSASLKDRANRTVSHVFTLLSLVLPLEPLQIARRGLQTDDDRLRGTALEYLESVLPDAIWEALRPLLDIARDGPRARVH